MNSPICKTHHAFLAGGARGAVAAIVAMLMLLGALSGCARKNDTRVVLHARQTADTDLGRMEILAQISGPQTGLRFKWYAVAGDCTPQESDWPTSVFRFAAGSVRDRVSVEVWRDGKAVADAAVDVSLDGQLAKVQREHLPKVKVEITKVPPYDIHGGPETRADIAGTVSGEVEQAYKVLIYARADAWYIQPIGGAQHAIRPDNTWASWTHTGSSYAALVVRPGYEPFARLDILPQVGGYVIARTIVDGKVE